MRKDKSLKLALIDELVVGGVLEVNYTSYDVVNIHADRIHGQLYECEADGEFGKPRYFTLREILNNKNIRIIQTN